MQLQNFKPKKPETVEALSDEDFDRYMAQEVIAGDRRALVKYWNGTHAEKIPTQHWVQSWLFISNNHPRFSKWCGQTSWNNTK